MTFYAVKVIQAVCDLLAIKSGSDFMLDITIDFEVHLSAMVTYKEYTRNDYTIQRGKVQKTSIQGDVDYYDV